MKPRFSVIVAVVAVAVCVRLAPYLLAQFGMSIDPERTTYPWNFSPMMPLCLFGGAFFARARTAYLLPFAAWLLGDLGILALTGRVDWAFYPNQPLVYLSLALVATTGFALRGETSWTRVAGAGLASSVGFFVITNFGVWAFGDGVLYPKTLSGLVDCYVRAIPFFRNTLISMAVFLPLLFSRVGLRNPAPIPLYRLATSRT